MFWFRSTVHINNTEPTGGFCPRSLLQYPLSSLPNLCITGAPIYFFLLPAQGDFTSKKKNRSFSHVRSRSPPFSLARSRFMKNKRSHRWRSAGVSLKRTCPVGMWMPLPLCKTLARERGGDGSQIILKGRKPVNDPNTLQMIISQACKDFISWCRWSFCQKCHIITSVDVYSGPVHLKVGHSFLPLRVLKDCNIIMQGIKRCADLRVWLSRAHKHLILQWWDRSRDCGHKQILWKYARALYYSALMCECALTEFSLLCALPSRVSHLECRPRQLLPLFHMHLQSRRKHDASASAAPLNVNCSLCMSGLKLIKNDKHESRAEYWQRQGDSWKFTSVWGS